MCAALRAALHVVLAGDSIAALVVVILLTVMLVVPPLIHAVEPNRHISAQLLRARYPQGAHCPADTRALPRQSHAVRARPHGRVNPRGGLAASPCRGAVYAR